MMTSAVTFGTGFAGITDIETSPDGNLYILLLIEKQKDKEVSTGYYLQVKELLLLEFLLLRLLTPLLPQLLIKVNRKPKRVQKMRRMGTAMIIMEEMIRMKIAMRMNDYE